MSPPRQKQGPSSKTSGSRSGPNRRSVRSEDSREGAGSGATGETGDRRQAHRSGRLDGASQSSEYSGLDGSSASDGRRGSGSGGGGGGARQPHRWTRHDGFDPASVFQTPISASGLSHGHSGYGTPSGSSSTSAQPAFPGSSLFSPDRNRSTRATIDRTHRPHSGSPSRSRTVGGGGGGGGSGSGRYTPSMSGSFRTGGGSASGRNSSGGSTLTSGLRFGSMRPGPDDSGGDSDSEDDMPQSVFGNAALKSSRMAATSADAVEADPEAGQRSISGVSRGSGTSTGAGRGLDSHARRSYTAGLIATATTSREGDGSDSDGNPPEDENNSDGSSQSVSHINKSQNFSALDSPSSPFSTGDHDRNDVTSLSRTLRQSDIGAGTRRSANEAEDGDNLVGSGGSEPKSPDQDRGRGGEWNGQGKGAVDSLPLSTLVTTTTTTTKSKALKREAAKGKERASGGGHENSMPTEENGLGKEDGEGEGEEGEPESSIGAAAHPGDIRGKSGQDRTAGEREQRQQRGYLDRAKLAIKRFLDHPEDDDKKVVITFIPIGDAPRPRGPRWRCEASRSRPFLAVVTFVTNQVVRQIRSDRNSLPSGGTRPVVHCFLQTSFAPRLDEEVGVLYDCFRTDNELHVYYALAQVFG